VSAIDVKVGRKAVSVSYDPARVTQERILEALRKAGEEAAPRRPRPARPDAEPRPLDGLEAVLRAFDRHAVVAIVKAPELAEEHDFVEAIIRHPAFSEKARWIVVDFGNSLYQPVLDRYLAGGEVPPAELEPLFHDSFWSPYLNWDAAVYARFFKAVREVNRALKPEKRLRILVNGPPIDWNRMQTPEDVKRFEREAPPERERVTRTLEKALAESGKVLIFASKELLLRGEPANATGRLLSTRPRSVFVVTPHLGFLGRRDDEERRLASWPKGSVVVLEGTWIGALYEDEQEFQEVADAYLYLGPAGSLTRSNPPPETYRDDGYFNELQRRLKVRYGEAAQPLDRAKLIDGRPRRYLDD
jgi:SAM-dependent methyltransferase